jgi:hypothetical protein
LSHRNPIGVGMRQTSGKGRSSSDKIIKAIKRATRKQYSAEEKIRIVLDGLHDEDSITLLLASQCKTVLSKASMVVSGMSA